MPGPGGVPGPEEGSAPGECLVLGGACSGRCLLQWGCLVETPPGWLMLHAVRILLECILVDLVSTELNLK